MIRKKTYFGMLVLLVLGLLYPVKAYAADKDMTVPFAQDYKKANFIFEFESKQQHDVQITTPDGRVVEYIVIDETANIEIEDAGKGTYEIHIEAAEEIKVKARVECSNQASSDVGNNLTVSSMLTNVKLYFYNGNLRGQWEDTGVGKVNVVVVNPKNMRTLASFSVNGNSFSCEISDSVESIEVYLVPASSAKVDGAGTAYTLQVVRELDATLGNLDVIVTNDASVTLDCELNENYEVAVYNNAELVYSAKLEGGTYELTVPLVSGINEIEAMVIDDKGNIVSSVYTVEKDIVAPSIHFTDNYDGFSTKDNSFLLSGFVKDAETVYVNKEQIEISSSGKFSVEYSLLKGENLITICAVDEAGNESVVNLTVTRKESNFFVYVVLVILLLLCAFVGLLLKNNKMKKPVEDKPVKENKKEVKSEKQKKAAKEPIKKTQKALLKQEKKEKEKRIAKIMKKGDRKNFALICVSYITMLIVIFLIVPNMIMICPVVSGSMEPTIMTGDIVIFNKLAYVKNDINRGDIISFESHEFDGLIFTKRVIGIGGDEISFKDGYVFINGLKAEESYINETFETNSSKTFIVPEGHIFVMGDNREDSKDSRVFENPYISIDDVKGKFLGQINWPF